MKQLHLLNINYHIRRDTLQQYRLANETRYQSKCPVLIQQRDTLQQYRLANETKLLLS